MVHLYLYDLKEQPKTQFWQEQLALILKENYGLSNQTIIEDSGGKPRLQSGEMYFNISHSRNTLVIAVADTEVGVDIEFFDRRISDRVKNYCLSEDEQKSAPYENVEFLKIWTAKESYLKLYGTGLRQAMKEFSVINDEFSSSTLPFAEFSRINTKEYTICVATKQKEKSEIKSR